MVGEKCLVACVDKIFSCWIKYFLCFQPQCYGWKYLSALEALIDDTTVDVDFLTGSMSDMLDMSFSSLVTSILEECDEDSARDQQPGAVCPVIQQQTGVSQVCYSIIYLHTADIG